MSSVVFIVILALAIVVMALVAMRRRAVSDRGQQKYPDGGDKFVPVIKSNAPTTRRRAYYGAVMEPGPFACVAAERLRGQRFLSADAPLLPLPDCDVAECKCMIRPSQDRRGPGDRRDEDLASFAGENDVINVARKEHREKKERREF